MPSSSKTTKKAATAATAATTSQPNHSSLSSIVSHLVRSSLGNSASAVPDDELDRHVAQQLLNEARAKQQEINTSAGATWSDTGKVR
jgi:hypothetical protein